jgi:hypothetical protein
MRVFLGCKLWLSQQRAVKALLGTNHTARIDHKLA